jgi:hypothetical protein
LLSQTLLPADTSITDVEYGSAKTANKAGIPDTIKRLSKRARALRPLNVPQRIAVDTNHLGLHINKKQFFFTHRAAAGDHRKYLSTDLKNQADQPEAARVEALPLIRERTACAPGVTCQIRITV